MSNLDRDPVSVASREVHGPSFGMGTLGLVAVLGLGAGIILGGVIMPLLRSSPPDQSQTEKQEAVQATNRALLFSMYPQTIYAPAIAGGDLVSTGMSVEQYLTELEVRSSQAGLSAIKDVERRGDTVEISYVFSDKEGDNSRTFPQSKIKLAHPKTLVLSFASGPLPGTIALQKTRVDGRERAIGASFVDFISLGAPPPQLAEGQFWTPRGVFEIKLTGTGVGAFLDNALVYPAAPPKPGPILAFPGSTPAQPTLTTILPRRLALVSLQPAVGLLKDRLILVASASQTDVCSAKAIILDAQRGTVLELAEPLSTPAVAVTNAKDALILNGFCAPKTTVPSTGQDSKAAQPALPGNTTSKLEIRLSARYDLKTGVLTWLRETIASAPSVLTPPLSTTEQTGVSTPWRAQGDTRLASPLISGGGLVSVACRPGGGVSITLSGLPAPPDGQSASVRFSSLGASATAQMRWRPTAIGYELDGASRPNEAQAILNRLRAGGDMLITASGGSKTVSAPGSAQIDQLTQRCVALAAKPTGTVTTPPVALKPAKLTSTTQPKVKAPAAKTLSAKAPTVKAPAPKPASILQKPSQPKTVTTKAPVEQRDRPLVIKSETSVDIPTFSPPVIKTPTPPPPPVPTPKPKSTSEATAPRKD